MLDKLRGLISSLNQPSGQLSRNDLQLASAALLMHAASVDGLVANEEKQTIKHLLADRFHLDADDIASLMEEAEAREKTATDLYGFTSTLTSRLDQDGRRQIVSMLWEVVLADGVVDHYEDHLVRRVAELLGVSTRDRIILRKNIEDRRN